MKRRMGERMRGAPKPHSCHSISHPKALRRGDWLNLIVDLLGSLSPTLASAFLPLAFCLGDSGLHFQSTLIIPIFQATSVLPMGGCHPSIPYPKCLCCFYILNWRFIFNIYYLR